MGFEGIPPGQILPYLLYKIAGVGEPWLPAIQAQKPVGGTISAHPDVPSGDLLNAINSPFTQDTLTQLLLRGQNREVWPSGRNFVEPYRNPERINIHPRQSYGFLESTLAHELVHLKNRLRDDKDTRTRFVEAWEAEREPRPTGEDTRHPSSKSRSEGLAYAMEDAFNRLRGQEPVYGYPGADVLFEWLQKTIKDTRKP